MKLGREGGMDCGAKCVNEREIRWHGNEMIQLAKNGIWPIYLFFMKAVTDKLTFSLISKRAQMSKC